MKTSLLALFVSSLIVGIGYYAIPSSTHSEEEFEHETSGGEAEEEGFGANMGSRKYFEYIRHCDPNTGIYNPQWRSESMRFAQRLPRRSDRSLDWVSRGPINKGGRTRSIAVDKTNPNNILAGSVTGGLWRSTNGGSDWSQTVTPGQLHSVSCISQDQRPGHENTWYFGTGEEFYGVVSGTSFTSLFSGDGMFKSTDNGQSWQQLISTASGTPQTIMQNTSYDYIWRIALDHTNTNEDIIYAAVYNGFIKSIDGGNTWTQILGFNNTTIKSEFTDITITPSGVLYATMSDNGYNSGGCFRSTDQGATWTKISADINNLRRIVMCLNPQNENEVYFLGETISNTTYPLDHFLYKYTYLTGDGSGTNGTWENRSANLPDTPCEFNIGVNFDFGTFRSQNSYDLCIAHHPSEANVLFIGGINIHRSDDAFATHNSKWIGGYRCNYENPLQYSYPNHHSDQHYMTFAPNDPSVMYSANDGGVYKTLDCGADSVAWTPMNHGYVTTQFYTVHTEEGQSNSDFVFGGMQDNGTWLTSTMDATANWSEVHADDGSYGALPQGRDFIITSSQLGRCFKKTIDSQGNLTGTERLDPVLGPSYLFINPLMLDPMISTHMYMAGNRTLWQISSLDTISVTGDYINAMPANRWDNISESLIPVAAGSITCLDKSPNDDTRVYYGTSGGKAYKLDNCFTTPTRTAITSTTWPNGYVSCITANDHDVNEVILSFSNYNIPSIFHTTDAGTTWENISGNLEENLDGTGAGPAVYWVEIYPSTPTMYFAATSVGLFSTSALNGTSTVWEMEGSETIGNVIINMVKTRPFDGKIVVGTHGNGVYSSQLTPVVSSNNIADVISDFKLYPNPFTDRVTIGFSHLSSGNVDFYVYDQTGKQVHVMQNQWLGQGNQTLQWEANSSLASGLYTFKIIADKKTYTGRAILRQ